MKSAGPLFLTATLLAAAVQAQDAAVADKPYASIVSRNMFGLLPIPPPPTNIDTPPVDPPPKITPNGTMTIFGKLEALFKVANKAKPGQPAKEDSYVLSEGERQDDIEVIKINQADGIITFNNHGKIEDLALVPAANTTAPCKTPCVRSSVSNRGASTFRGGRDMSPASSGSASNTIEETGSMINSRKTTCIGPSTSGQPNRTGISDMPAIGTCTAKIYAMAFLKLSNILRPSLTAATIEDFTRYRMLVDFPPAVARYVRIRLTAPHRTMQWSIYELLIRR